MVRGISKRFKEIYPDSEIIYETNDLENDSKILEDCDTVTLEKIRTKIFTGKQKNLLYRGIRFIKKKLNIANVDDYIHINTDWTKDCDILVIIGGDIFDLVPSRIGKKYQNDRIYISKLVKERGGKVVLWGISVGSFEKDLKAKKVLIDYFKNVVDFAAIRDKKSFEYLRNSGVQNNINLYSDPAYMLRTIQIEDNDQRVLGINLSPLSNRYLEYKKDDNEWIDVWSDIIVKIYNKLDMEKVMLIPHVVNPHLLEDDDFSYLEKVEKKLTEKGIPVCLIKNKKGFLQIKEELVKCTILLSARMHCAVNAITCGVPTVFLSYSPKSIGMCEHIYNNTEMVFDMNKLIETPDQVIEKIKNINEHNVEIREYLKKRNVELYENACSVSKDIEEFLREGTEWKK